MIESLSSLTGKAYLSIDCDGLSTSYMPGVGTPVPGGIEYHQLLAILRAIFDNKNMEVRGMDIVELMPIEGQVLSEFSAAKIFQKLLTMRCHKR